MNKYLFIILTILLQGCTSNLYLTHKQQFISDSQKSSKIVRVANPEHVNFPLFVKSGIYKISSDLRVSSLVTLTDSEKPGHCGMGILAAIYTAGILPGYANANEMFNYSIAEAGTSVEKKYQLEMYQRYSVWEWLFKPFKYNRTATRAKALKIAFDGEKAAE